jgi:hypothetical protein
VSGFSCFSFVLFLLVGRGCFKFVGSVPDDDLIALRVFGHEQMIQLRRELHQQKWACEVARESR